jgi:hypothetical protein
MKLIRVERAIEIHSNNKKNKLIKEHSVDHIDIEILRKISNSDEQDLEVYDCYELDENQIMAFNEYLLEKIEPDFKKFFYVLVCLGIYESESKNKMI